MEDVNSNVTDHINLTDHTDNCDTKAKNSLSLSFYLKTHHLKI